MSNILIGIHGLSNKPEANVLAEWWEAAIKEGLMKNEGIDNPEIEFSSVYWADVLYPEPDNNPDSYNEAKEEALKTYEESWTDSVRTGLFNWGGNIIDSMKKNFGMDAMADEVLEHKLPDLYRYYEEEDIRKELRKRLNDEILRHKEKRIMILSHSMGTIIAYDVLRAIGKEYPRMVVDHFVTLGSPLGLPHVKYKIAQESSLVRTPSIVMNWSNFADKRDPVALDVHLAGDYAPNTNGVKVKDDLIANDWEGIHHKSYGYLRAPEVSKLIKSFI
ncbi:hypothetical protein QUF80_12660 [Desulfococcaceae bacterium HSG8]|nr:hypothetical protein [Desulfococcaceae bacterium HSG8]